MTIGAARSRPADLVKTRHRRWLADGRLYATGAGLSAALSGCEHCGRAYNSAMPDSSTSTGPLAGVRVLELGNFIAGPVRRPAARRLRRRRDQDRGARRRRPDAPLGHHPRGRRTVVADDRAQQALGRRRPAHRRGPRARAVDRAHRATSIVENFRPGRLADFGLDYDTLAPRNPGVIVVHVSGFGQTGPRAAGGRLRLDRRGRRRHPPHHRRPRPPAGPLRHQPRRLARRAVRRDRHARRAPRARRRAARARRSTSRSTRRSRR